mmetsp:Transcript_11851/g.33397  ORF Transcript_11851/g.33397 Transcript_11851/m.33397 type:complete len:214 (-) Transcript_11851:9-650(-)
MNSENDQDRLRLVIDAMVKPKEDFLDLDPVDLRFVKRLASRSKENVKVSFLSLMQNLPTPNSQVRLLTLELVHQLFMRSRYFRLLLLQSGLPRFADYVVGYRISRPLPEPEAVAVRLRMRALEVLELWYEDFGHLYRQLHVAYNYLKYTRKAVFPEVRLRNARAEAEQAEREKRAEELFHRKFVTLAHDFDSYREEMRALITEAVRFHLAVVV